MHRRLAAIGAALALATSAGLAAQSTHDSSVAGRTVTLTGCVERASDVLGAPSASGYVLVRVIGGSQTASTGTPADRVYRLSGEEVGLSGELGNTVVVKGAIADMRVAEARDDRPTGTSGRSAAAPTDRDRPSSRFSATVPEVQVQSVQRTSGQCPAGW